MARTDAGDVAWIFGYGSLLWRPGFRFAERQPAVLRGWMRRFWQASPDHRGAPEAPGRVVTLRRAADSSCWGMAFRVAGPDRADVLAALDHREKALDPTRAGVGAVGRDAHRVGIDEIAQDVEVLAILRT